MRGIAAVVLAAGASQRFGPDNKLLASVGGQPLIRHVTQGLIRSGVTDIVVVTGDEKAPLEAALDELPVRFAHNENWTEGMASSIGAGVASLGPEIDGAFVVPADMPFLTSALIERLVAAFEAGERNAIVYPANTAGEQRNPVLWPRRYFAELMALSGQQGAKRLLAALAAASVAVAIDDAVFLDIDTEADLAVARARLGQ